VIEAHLRLPPDEWTWSIHRVEQDTHRAAIEVTGVPKLGQRVDGLICVMRRAKKRAPKWYRVGYKLGQPATGDTT